VRFAAVSTAAMALGVQTVTTGFLMEMIRSRGEHAHLVPQQKTGSEYKSTGQPISKAAA
jgi:hypothetical protein